MARYIFFVYGKIYKKWIFFMAGIYKISKCKEDFISLLWANLILIALFYKISACKLFFF